MAVYLDDKTIELLMHYIRYIEDSEIEQCERLRITDQLVGALKMVLNRFVISEEKYVPPIDPYITWNPYYWNPNYKIDVTCQTDHDTITDTSTRKDKNEI